MTLSSSNKYFHTKADQYDDVDKQLYWVLSDALLWIAFKSILDTLPSSFSFLDAGGGTGRWTNKILHYYPKSTGVLYDLSKDMLEVAKIKFKTNSLSKRLHIYQGNVIKSPELNKNSFNISFNFHNVIGFVDNPKKFIKRLASVTRKNGYVVTFAPNYYHAIYFNTSIGNIKQAQSIAKKFKGKFTSEMPDIHFFTPQRISQLYKNANLNVTWLTGFPNTIYPNFQETQLSGQTTNLANLLSNKQTFKSILQIEKKLYTNQDISSRGNNIFIVGKKR